MINDHLVTCHRYKALARLGKSEAGDLEATARDSRDLAWPFSGVDCAKSGNVLGCQAIG